MPLKDKTARNAAVARAVRRCRLYDKALAAGHHLALAADAAYHPMRPAQEMMKRLMALPSKAARNPFKAEYDALEAQCKAISRADARKHYLELRAQLLDALAAEQPAPAVVDPFG